MKKSPNQPRATTTVSASGGEITIDFPNATPNADGDIELTPDLLNGMNASIRDLFARAQAGEDVRGKSSSA